MKAPAKVWGIRLRSGEIALPTIRSGQRRCIREYMDSPGNAKVTWRELKRWGWSCVPLSLRQLKV